MEPSRLILLSMFIGTALLSQAAHSGIDPGASVVKLRTSCSEGSTALNNCFTSMSGVSGLQNWIDHRTVTTPLVVEVGPGTFGAFNCGRDDISLRGSGPGKTILAGGSSNFGIQGRCNNLSVQDLTVSSTFIAVMWGSTGSSRWSNVNLEGGLYGWSELCDNATNGNKPIHYWFNSSIRAHGKTAYLAGCSENWFFGSEIMVSGPGFAGQLEGFIVTTSEFNNNTARPEVHVYGSVIRVKADTEVVFPVPTFGTEGLGIIGVAAGKNADVHIHGTGIDVIGNELPNGVAALVAWDGGKIHANEAAYNLKTGAGGTVTRIIKDTNPDTHVHAPYLWPEHDTPPNITSVTGADMAVVTTSAAFPTSDGHPHLVIYDKTCTTASAPNSKWYDTVDKRCLP